MKYISTRDETGTAHTFKHVIMQGLSPDGGLFVPSEVCPYLQSSDSNVCCGRFPNSTVTKSKVGQTWNTLIYA